MRTIEFRGIPVKDSLNRFVYGNYRHKTIRIHGESNDTRELIELDDNHETSIEVRHSTIGQLTPLIDKKRAKIYDGDIVKWDDCSDGEYWRFAVVQINPDIQFNCSLIKQVGGVKNSSTHIFRLAKFAYEDTHNHLEIIGNIHQNPELLI